MYDVVLRSKLQQSLALHLCDLITGDLRRVHDLHGGDVLEKKKDAEQNEKDQRGESHRDASQRTL